jgi:outer membrane biosynthesis protein TonB
MNLGQIGQLLAHPQWGEIAKSISLEEIAAARAGFAGPPSVVTSKSNGKAPKPEAAKAKAPKAKPEKAVKAKAPKAKPEKAPKAAKPEKAAKAKAPKPEKAPKAGRKVDHDKGQREVLAVVKAKAPVQLAAIVAATKLKDHQVRLFCQELKAAGKIKDQGKGRGTHWVMA